MPYYGLFSSENIPHASIDDPAVVSLVELMAREEALEIGMNWEKMDRRLQDELIATVLITHFPTVVPIIDRPEGFVQ